MANKKEIKANELVQADVHFVSLVTAGANRIPIRMTKSKEGKQMLDFTKIFKKAPKKDAAPGAYVAAVIISKEADLADAKAKIVKAGFSIEHAQDAEVGTLFIQKEVTEDALQYVMKVNDHMALHVVTEKSLDLWDYETQSFSELFNKAGVLPSMMMACDLLKECFMNILFGNDIEDPEQAAAAIKTAVKEFNNIVTEMAARIPVSAFKMEGPAIATPPKGDPIVDKKEEAKKTEEAPAAAAEAPKTETQKGGNEAEVAETEAAAAAPAKKSDEPSDMETLAQAIVGLTDQVTKMVQSNEETKKIAKDAAEAVQSLAQRVEGIDKVAKSANDALAGTTAAIPPTDKAVVAKKAESVPVLKDSGFSKAKASW